MEAIDDNEVEVMYVIKRDGRKEEVSFDKITRRIRKLFINDDHKFIDPIKIAQKTIVELYNHIKTTELDILSSKICHNMAMDHYKYNHLGARIAVSNLHKNTNENYYEVVQLLFKHNCVNEKLVRTVEKYQKEIQDMFDYNRDYNYDYFGFKTLERSYLLKINDVIIERPQHLIMRVAVSMFKDKVITDSSYLQDIKETYDMMSMGYFTHATPTLFNAGTNNEQLASCFLLTIQEDSLNGIFDTYKQCANISKWAGGIGLSISNIRGLGSEIKGTKGKSLGIIPLCKTVNEIARHINQGGKRLGSFALYLEPHHPDICEFLELRLPIGVEEMRARDIFTALWISDLFMKRVKTDGMWSLFDPSVCPDLQDAYGEEYEKLYEKYEKEKKYMKQIKVSEIWNRIIKSLVETGTPYIMYKDHVNRKNNQKNLGTIRSSNLCVQGDTLLLTDNGMYKIKELENKEVKVWNGKSYTNSIVRKTGVNQKIIKLVFSNHIELETTEYHKFHLLDGKIKEAKDLTYSDIILDYELPIIDNTENLFNKIYELTIDGIINNSDKLEKMLLLIKNYPLNCSLRVKNKWLFVVLNQNYYSKNITRSGDLLFIKNDKDFITKLILLLNTYGIICKTVIKEINNYILVLNNLDILQLKKCGVKINIDNFENSDKVYSLNMNLHIIKIIDDIKYEDTFCLNEEKFNRVIFNGIITGNCTEIVEFTSKDEVAVCNLCSIALSKFVKPDKTFDFKQLALVTERITKNLNRVIDINFYPIVEAERSNFKHRPIAIGVQGWQDCLFMMKYPFESKEANDLNKQIFEVIYYSALKTSCNLAKIEGPYESFKGSYFSEGKLQFDLWGVTDLFLGSDKWNELKEDIKINGTRNSLLTSLMPTASTSQILGNYECFEPITNNFYTRKTLAGKFSMINKYLVDDLIKLRLWNSTIKNKIMLNKGSIQNIPEIPKSLQDLYKTIWEVRQKAIIDQNLSRGPFIDQSQSMNIYIDKNKCTNSEYMQKINSFLMYAWQQGSKNGVYYLRSQPAVDADQVTVTKETKEVTEKELEKECLSCSS